MARFDAWWTEPDMATPASVAAAAHAAGVLVEAGDYTVATFDLGDGGPPAGIQVSGSVVAAEGATWLVYPAPSRVDGWHAQQVERHAGAIRPASTAVPRTLGAANDRAERIIAALSPTQLGARVGDPMESPTGVRSTQTFDLEGDL